MSTGERPTGVRIVDRSTGESTVCELADRGEQINPDDGLPIHVWEVASPLDPRRHYIEVDVMPGRTTIEFHVPKTAIEEAS